MTEVRRGNRVIHLNGGIYKARINGNHVQGKSDTAKPTERNITSESEVIDAKPKNYVENLGGKKVNHWF